MSILDTVKDVADKVMGKDHDEEQGLLEKATGGIGGVLDLFGNNKDFAGEVLDKVKLPDLDIGDTIGKMFGAKEEAKPDKDLIGKVVDMVKDYLMKNPKVLMEVMKIASKFM